MLHIACTYVLFKHPSIAAVTLYGFRFGLSAAVDRANEETAGNKRVYLDQKKICNAGRAEYLSGARGIHRVSKWFQDAVMGLSEQYSNSAYMDFIKNWGTVSLQNNCNKFH